MTLLGDLWEARLALTRARKKAGRRTQGPRVIGLMNDLEDLRDVVKALYRDERARLLPAKPTRKSRRKT